MLQFLFSVTDYILAAVLPTHQSFTMPYENSTPWFVGVAAEIYSFSDILGMQDYIVKNNCKRNTTFKTYLWVTSPS